MKFLRSCLWSVAGLVILCSPLMAQQKVRIKDVTTVAGEHHNVLTGMGLVVGLAGTGGTGPTTKQFAINMQQKLGNRADPRLRENIQQSQDKTDNMSVVSVRAILPPHFKKGQKIDVIVSTFDNAKSLQGGVLLDTELTGTDNVVYALASGPVSTNGGEFGGQAATVTKNHPTTGRIPQGASVEEEVPCTIIENDVFRLNLINPDYSTANNMCQAINMFAPQCAAVIDPATVAVRLPSDAAAEPFRFISQCQELMVEPNIVARVLINERTGTIVMGANVRLSQVAITHGNLIVSTAETPEVSQPAPFSEGETTVVPRTTVDVTEEGAVINVLEQNATVGELAASLNALGVSPRDLSVILQMLKESGALHARIDTL